MQKIWLQRGGSRKNMVCKGGGGHQKIAFKFSSGNICNSANISARKAKIEFLRF